MRKILAGLLVGSGLTLATSVAFAGNDNDAGDRGITRMPAQLTQAQVQPAPTAQFAVAGARMESIAPTLTVRELHDLNRNLSGYPLGMRHEVISAALLRTYLDHHDPHMLDRDLAVHRDFPYRALRLRDYYTLSRKNVIPSFAQIAST